ncbi:MAG TPA: class I SAM-dependent methyltransferase [Caulobacteraceae bacterium]|jgi:23S rRNA (cytosine1962-C5)-methyltransferase|nr:class I SAM-dependent methyltransferase [Caulobacteraceae bacterium]
MSRPAPVIAPSPLAMRPATWPDYDLLDSGGGRKLERYGDIVVVRPEAQCLWPPARPPEWDHAVAVFEGAEDDEAGRWRRRGETPESWPMAWRDVRFHARLAAFRHLGVFPEQASNWAWLADRLDRAQGAPNVLNLFGYTGVASLVAATAGARVTHVDASKKAVAWARENAVLSGLEGAPVRWICEDARAYVRREARRGSRYAGIILDPPKYGRGPGGEVWRLYEDLPDLLAGCAALLSEDAEFLILNAYSERLSGLALASLLAETLADRGGRIEWGELTLAESSGGRGMGLSFFARWSRS